MMPEMFLDTSYAIALSSKRDRFHSKALELAEKLEAENTKLITARPVGNRECFVRPALQTIGGGTPECFGS